MQSTLIRRSNYGMTADGVKGIHPWRQRVGYKAFQSKFGPQYKIQPHVYGITARKVLYFGTLAATFGASAGAFAIFFFGEVPRVKRDILSKVPVIGGYFVKEIAPEDNPF
ncbi:uncharacterized protein K489DRAFT_406003 [Dissoconium aciculare CBS 342.82]|uniref:Uncharacterized protein n=1 Tax=Dissoconium aciculare CBS 342.82 TaxID=1314786 RepID=A0A6J3MH67_9PEZI|nr:uncharacterized protein K489DRAFT_406003 [Dissoconium aciculare CBS 342.82]KAF1827285.1 hypothetical protein K489DRAFT_406003 [Dissoconium aciculare CBS 342.82]